AVARGAHHPPAVRRNRCTATTRPEGRATGPAPATRRTFPEGTGTCRVGRVASDEHAGRLASRNRSRPPEPARPARPRGGVGLHHCPRVASGAARPALAAAAPFGVVARHRRLHRGG